MFRQNLSCKQRMPKHIKNDFLVEKRGIQLIFRYLNIQNWMIGFGISYMILSVHCLMNKYSKVYFSTNHNTYQLCYLLSVAREIVVLLISINEAYASGKYLNGDILLSKNVSKVLLCIFIQQIHNMF